MNDTLSFKLPLFEGPLDLLLHLVQKNKINIENIPIAEITAQYLEYIDLCQQFDIELASEFLVMAAHLMLIKSNMLLPAPLDDEPDLAEELSERLAEYKKIKEAAKLLENTQFSTIENYFKAPEGIEKAPIVNKEMPVDKLLGAFYEILRREIAKTPPPKEAFTGIVHRERIPVEHKLKDVLNKIHTKGKIRFSELFSGLCDKDELIASFLALLQLISRGKVSAHEQDDEIYLIG